MPVVTRAFNFYMNLFNAAVMVNRVPNHGVSIAQLKMTANEYVLPFCSEPEVKIIKKLEWPV